MAIVICPNCGRETSNIINECSHCRAQLKAEPKNIAKKVVLITIAGLLAVAAIFAVLILSRPNIEMDDFDVTNGEFETLLFLGVPTEKENTDVQRWRYIDCGITFYDIPINELSYNFSEGIYILEFDDAYASKLRYVLEKNCDVTWSSYPWVIYAYSGLDVSAKYDYDVCYLLVDLPRNDQMD